MKKFIDFLRGKKSNSFSLATILYRDTLLVVTAMILFITCIAFYGLYYNYNDNLETYKVEYINKVKEDLQDKVQKAIMQTEMMNKNALLKAQSSLVDNVNFGIEIAKSIEMEYSRTKSKKRIMNSIKRTLQNVRVDDGAGYYFILDEKSGYTYLHALDSRFEGKSQIDFKDANGRYIIKEMLDVVKNDGSGFISYSFLHPVKKTTVEKVTYVKGLKKLGIVIGMGFYKSDVESNVKENVKELVGNLITKGDDYIWVVDYEGKLIAHKYLKKLIGKSTLYIKDPSGIPIVQSFIETAANGEGFLDYSWIKPSTGTKVPKLGYSRRYDKWGWLFVTGRYIDDIQKWENEKEQSLKNSIIQHFLFAILAISLFLLFLGVIIKRNITNLENGFKVFNSFFTNPTRPLTSDAFENLPYEEFQLLSKSTEIISQYHQMLREEKTKAENSLIARNEFINNMSHEIRTPMNVIIGMADFLDESKMTKEQKAFLDSFQDACNTLLTVLNDILDLSKLESDSFELEKKEFNLDTKLENTVELFRHSAKQKELEIRLDFSKDVHPMVNCDQVRLGQIISNLIGNSIKFTQFGHVEVRVTKVKEEGSIQRLKFSVYDTGIGIEKESVDKIFLKFMQADSSVTRKYGGTGLGLSISKKIVDAFGGELKVNSEPAKFTEFSFEIDVEFLDVATITKPDIVYSEAKLNKKSKLLVVDDTEDNLLLIKKFLEHPELTIVFAKNGIEALEVFRREDFDMILMDIQMPVMDGYEATQQIRVIEKESGGHVPIYALTAYAMTENIEKSLAAGCDGHLSKPIRKKDIQRFIFSKLG